MQAREVRKVLVVRYLDRRAFGCVELRQRGSHLRIGCPCWRHSTTVPIHAGAELPPGLVRAIERDLEPCLGKGWLRQ